MKRALIRKGDPTSHGGVVLEGCERVRALGQPVAAKGHMTYCPACRGNFPIDEGVARVTAFGSQVALDGMKTRCGATLIATQQSVRVDDGAGSGITGQVQKSESQRDKASYSGRLQAVDEITGAPVSGLAYTVTHAGGRAVTGYTDAQGYTATMTSDSPDSISVRWGCDILCADDSCEGDHRC